MRKKKPLKQKRPELHVLIPACAESAWLPRTLASLAQQTQVDFQVWVCVNHAPDAAGEVVEDNAATLKWLRDQVGAFPFELHVLDVTGSAGPPAHLAGVGWARDHLARAVIAARGSDILLVSLDADTTLDAGYLEAVEQAFERYPNALGLAAPYYHAVPDDAVLAFGLLRYELYMRYYQVQLWRAGCAYAFLPLGSAMAFRAEAFLKIGGIPHRQAGEDFYFLSKLRKMGPLIRWLPQRVYPASRPSQRVPFGTGALIGEALAVQQARFPFYDPADFERLADTYAAFPRWYAGDEGDFGLRAFWLEKLGGEATIAKLRRNARNVDAFVRACHEKLDGLRVLQALRFYREASAAVCDDATALRSCLRALGETLRDDQDPLGDLGQMTHWRDVLAAHEAAYQKDYMAHWDQKARW